MKKAANDLIAAQATLPTARALDTVCFHAQQAAQKTLKAILALDDVTYPRRHDLGELVELVRPRFPEVAEFEAAVVALSPFAVTARYDDAVEPTADQARAALDTARRLHMWADRVLQGRSGKGCTPDS